MRPPSIAFEIAQDLGFDLAGATPLGPPKRAPEFEAWLDAGRHGSMDYLERQRERITAPQSILPAAQSLLVVGMAHSRPAIELEGGARVARYAAGRDYHNYIGKRLKKLGKRLDAEGFGGPHRGIVDAGPILERSHAAEAGVGAESKAGNLLAPEFGPWFFIGELLIGEELEPGAASDLPLPNCGTCTACIDVCPTEAIVAPGEIDARLCISYLTIEHHGPIPRELRDGIGPWVFGCDLCSEVCPWGTKAPDHSERFGTHAVMESHVEGGPLVKWLAESQDTFSQTFNGSPLQRPKREGLARNAAIVLGNVPSDAGRDSLLRALKIDPSPIVRGSAAWSLGKAHAEDAGVRMALESALTQDRDTIAASEISSALER